MGKIIIRDVPRARDDQLLAMLRLRCAGETTYALGKRFDTDPANLGTVLKRVLDDDLKFSDEPADVVRSGYWRGA